MLRRLELPTLRGRLISPKSSLKLVESLAEELAAACQASSLQVRTDGGAELRQYVAGGCTFPVSVACAVSHKHSIDGRWVILLEPTNRFANRLSLSASASSNGNLTFELLGPGYDVSDLTRGGVQPRFIVRGSTASWDAPSALSPERISIVDLSQAEDSRREARLRALGHRVLPQVLSTGQVLSCEEVEKWLRARGYSALWEDWEYYPEFGDIRCWYRDLHRVARYLGKRGAWLGLSLTASVLEDGRFVYWDFFESKEKWLT